MLPAPTAAQRPATPAQDQAREAADRARVASSEEQRLAQQRVAAAEQLRIVETQLNDRIAEVSALTDARTAAEARLRQHAAALAPLLPLMERLALYPAETLLAVPGPPEDALRGLGILHGMAATLERDAAGLRQDQAELDTRAKALDQALSQLRAVQATQTAQAQALDQQLAAARALRQTTEQAGAEAQRRAATEAARSDTLRGALATLEAARAKAEAQARDDAARAERQRQDQAAGEARRREAALAHPPAPTDHAQLIAPVAGAVVRAWGEPTDAGPATGVSYRPAPQARVVAPCAGRIRFAGPFRSFGALVILDCGGGLAFVLAGLDRLDVPIGAAVLQGEPLGTMPAWTGGSSRPALYLELRRDGQAVNPAPFLHTEG